MIYDTDKKVFVQFDLILVTNTLSQNNENEDHQNKLKLINKLSNDGLNSKEISNYLNSRNIKSHHGKEFYPSLVWTILKKYRNRPNRKPYVDRVSLTETLYYRTFYRS